MSSSLIQVITKPLKHTTSILQIKRLKNEYNIIYSTVWTTVTSYCILQICKPYKNIEQHFAQTLMRLKHTTLLKSPPASKPQARNKTQPWLFFWKQIFNRFKNKFYFLLHPGLDSHVLLSAHLNLCWRRISVSPTVSGHTQQVTACLQGYMIWFYCTLDLKFLHQIIS